MQAGWQEPRSAAEDLSGGRLHLLLPLGAPVLEPDLHLRGTGVRETRETPPPPTALCVRGSRTCPGPEAGFRAGEAEAPGVQLPILSTNAGRGRGSWGAGTRTPPPRLSAQRAPSICGARTGTEDLGSSVQGCACRSVPAPLEQNFSKVAPGPPASERSAGGVIKMQIPGPRAYGITLVARSVNSGGDKRTLRC